MGLGGNPGHLKSLYKALTNQFEKGAVVHIAKSNSGFKTMDGAALGANRVVKELLELLVQLADKGIRIVKLSIIGYSFGGVISRYAIGLLYRMGFFETVEPCIFATFATPHVGSVFPSPKLRFRVLNALGSVMLGLTGKDLFATNDILDDLADPTLDYFKGLELFRHHMLFANAVWDRTVPFWTSYLTAKSPFKDPQHMDLKFYDHLHGLSTEGVSKTGRVPFLVDMKNSRYEEEANEPSSGLTSSEKRQRLLLLLFPVFVPVLLLLLTAGTIQSHVKYGILYKNIEFSHPKLFDRFKKSLEQGRSSGTSENDIRKLERKLNEDLAAFAGSAIDDMLIDTSDPGYENIQPSQVTKGAPQAATSSEGLLDDSPWNLEIPANSQKNIDNLNKIKWKKYAVKLLHVNAHGEIVDRRQANNQGAELMKFFARITQKLLADDAKKQLV